MANIDDELDSDETDTVPDATPAAAPPPKLTPDQAQALLANDLAANANKGPAAQTPYGLQALTDMLGAKTNLDKVAAGAPLPDPNMVIGPAKRLTPLPTGGGAHAAMAPAVAAAPAGDAVDAALAPEAQDAKDHESLRAIHNVSDPAVDAQRAANAAQARQEQEIQDAIAESKAGRQQNFGQAFMTALADPSGKLRQQQLEQADMPLKDLLQKRQMLAQVQDERVKREGEQRQRDMYDPNSEVSKQSAMIYKAMTGKDAPKGYVAAAHGQIKELSEMTAKQRNDELERLSQEHRDTEAKRHNMAQEHIENARLAAEQAEKAAALAAKGAGGAEKLNPESVKATNQVSGLGDLNELFKQHQKTTVGNSLLPFGNSEGNQYAGDVAARGANVAAAGLSLGRETPEAVKEAKAELPTKFTSNEVAHNYFKTKYASIRDNAMAQIQNMEASGTSPKAAAQLRADLAKHDAEARASGLLGGPAGAKPVTRTVGGVTKQWNGSQWVAL
jgi:hypothetical protein